MSLVGCPESWTALHGFCYRLSFNSLDWRAAKFACKALGSNLTMLNLRVEQQHLRWGERTWIGLHRDSSDNSSWLWIDGSQAVNMTFDSNQPVNFKQQSEDCVYMRPSGKWNHLNCNEFLNYSCKLPAGWLRNVIIIRLHSLCILWGGGRIFFKGAEFLKSSPHIIQNVLTTPSPPHLLTKKKN